MTDKSEYKEFYMKKFNSEAAIEFWKLCGRIEKYVGNKRWELTRKHTQHYIAFKYGRQIVFGVHYNNKNKFSIFFKAEKYRVNNLDISDYERYKGHTEEIRYYIPSSGDLDLEEFDELFEASYDTIIEKYG